MQKLRRNKYEIFDLYFTSYTFNLMKGNQAQYGLLKKKTASIYDLFIFTACYDTSNYLNKKYNIIL